MQEVSVGIGTIRVVRFRNVRGPARWVGDVTLVSSEDEARAAVIEPMKRGVTEVVGEVLVEAPGYPNGRKWHRFAERKR